MRVAVIFFRHLTQFEGAYHPDIKANMAKAFLVPVFIVFLALSSLQLLASPQLPDYVIYKGDTLATYTLILEKYFQKQGKADQGELFGLSFRDGASLNCWRGYQAIYKIDNDSLFLADIIHCSERTVGEIDKAASVEKMKAIFNGKFSNDRVYIDWFSGDMKFPLTNKVLRWDGLFYTIYEREKVLSITGGKLSATEDVENYVDDPNRINRREKDRVSDILFKRLKKAKWKNKEEFDCSEKYMVTIDGNGNVSKVRMLYSEEEIEKYFEKDEYNFCVGKVYDALKSLKFDIIKDKGKPVAEEIYIRIWIDDNGKVENRTR